MNRKTYAITLTGVLAVMAVLIAGCGSSSSNGGAYGGGETSSGSTNSSSGYSGKSASPANASNTSNGGGAGVVAVAKVGDLGPVIVNSEGLTLYDFHKDKGGKSSCYGACASAWPPLLTEGEPKAEAGAMSNQLGTTRRNDGTVQVTYAGWPLYTYVGDKGPGEANGNDFSQFGAQWYALMPNGEEPGD